MSNTLLHIINPFDSPLSDQRHIQEITFQSIGKALAYGTGHLEVGIRATRFAEDRSILPKYIKEVENLKRSVVDFGDFKIPRQLPLIADILENAFQEEADYYLYTNIDIALQPHFYSFVAEQIRKGHDALIINRRRIPWKYADVTLEEMYQVSGKSHPGFDCFVFTKEIAHKLQLGHICVGIPFIGVVLAHNLFAHARKLGFYDQEHLTFHLGMEVMPPRDQPYYWHNRREFFGKVKHALWPYFRLRNFPYSDRGWLVGLVKWALNPSLFTLFYLKLSFREIFYRGNK